MIANPNQNESKKQTTTPIEPKELVYSPEYLKLLDNAQRWAALEDSELTTTRHLFLAVARLFPEVLSAALGRPVETRSGESKEEAESDERFLLELPRLDWAPAAPETSRRFRGSAEFERVLSPYGGRLGEVVKLLSPEEPIGPAHVAIALLLEPARDVADFLARNGIEIAAAKRRVREYLAALNSEEKRKERRCERVRERVEKIRRRLESEVVGQNEAVDAICSTLANFWSQEPSERNGRPASIVIVGDSGSGKTLLAETLQAAIADALNVEQCATIDMSAYYDPQMAHDLTGRDRAWRDGGKSGEMTGRAKQSPKAAIVFDGVEGASRSALRSIVNVVDSGAVVDKYDEERVSFAHNVMIVVSRIGAEFFESDEYAAYLKRRGLGSDSGSGFGGGSSCGGASVPRDLLRDALRANDAGLNAVWRQLLEKADAVVAMKRLDVGETSQLLARFVFRNCVERLSRMGVALELDESAERRLVAFLLETQEAGFRLLGDLKAQAETFLLRSVRDLVWRLGASTRRSLRVEIDDFPELGVPFDEERLEAYSLDWIAARTKKRRALGKRLVYSTQVEEKDGVMTLKATEMKYATLPSVEDFGFFSAVPADVSFDDLVGVDRARDNLTRVLDFMRDPKGFGLRPETGVLLVGPPGTGKTSLAKALARELETPFIAVAGPDLTSAERVAAVFRAARKYDAVVFIDEIDSIGARGVNPFGDAIVNALLAELDGFSSRERPTLVVAATNRGDALDKALRRPGRFGRVVCVDNLTNPEDRSALIDKVCERSKTSLRFDEATKQAVVAMSEGFSPALLTACVRDALWAAYSEGRSTVSQDDFVEAMEVAQRGEFTQTNRLEDEDRRCVAIHEAGHALVAARRGLRVTRATIESGGNDWGSASYMLEKGRRRTNETLLKQIDVALAGFAAERAYFGVGEETLGSESDFESATALALAARRGGLDGSDRFARFKNDDATLQAVDNFLKKRMSDLVVELTADQAALDALATALEKRTVLHGQDVERLIKKSENKSAAEVGKTRVSTGETARQK